MGRAQERVLLARLEAARQVGATCLGQARTRARLVRQSTAFQRARTLSREDPERRALFAQARTQRGGPVSPRRKGARACLSIARFP